jgi:S-adenosylmethionine hydrolase
MAKSNNAFIKKQKAEVKRKKRLEKEAKKDARKREPTDGSLENMMAYVDEFGNLTTEPPEKKIESSTTKKQQ